MFVGKLVVKGLEMTCFDILGYFGDYHLRI